MNHVPKESVITFDTASANISGGFDASSGQFKVPKSGIYRFYFSGMSDKDSYSIHIYVKKNDVSQLAIHYNNNDGNRKTHELISYTWTMALLEEDVVKLYLSQNDLYRHNSHYYVYFSGELLVEE